MQPLNLILILDNVEDILCNDSLHFKEFLFKLLTESHGIRFLLTARCSIGCIKDITEKIHIIKNMGERESARLFELKAPRKLNPKEIGELLDEDVSS